MYLKELITANSPSISFGLRQLVADEFFYEKNWDGRKAESIKQFAFFNSVLFGKSSFNLYITNKSVIEKYLSTDSWKSGVLTKMVYIKSMRREIKKAHDRHYRYLKSIKIDL